MASIKEIINVNQNHVNENVAQILWQQKISLSLIALRYLGDYQKKSLSYHILYLVQWQYIYPRLCRLAMRNLLSLQYYYWVCIIPLKITINRSLLTCMGLFPRYFWNLSKHLVGTGAVVLSLKYWYLVCLAVYSVLFFMLR